MSRYIIRDSRRIVATYNNINLALDALIALRRRNPKQFYTLTAVTDPYSPDEV